MKSNMKAKLVILLCLLTFWSLVLPDKISFGADQESLKRALESEIKASGAEVGLAFKDLETGKTVFIREKEMMHAASTMKVPVMIEVFRQAEKGKFGLDNRLPLRNEFHSLVNGSLFYLNKEDDSDKDIYALVGGEMSIRALTERMITVSSNFATNILVDLVQAKNVMATLQELGIRRMQVLRGVEDSLAYEKGLNNQTDACDLMLVMEAIAGGKASSEAACQEMIRILRRQTFRNGIPAGVPQGVPVGNKTGSITGMEHDAAIVFPPGRKPYVLAILTRGIRDGEQGEKLIACLSRLIYAEVAGK
jgi:beta-lactamase class A